MPSILLNTDPTRTTLLRNQFVADMVRRFKEISKAIDALILGDEALGLINPGVRSVDELIGNVEFQAWRFQTNPQKVKSFRRWLQTEIDDNILTTSGGVVDKPWTATYIEPAYKKGVTRARTDTGRAFPGIQGTKEEFLRTSFTGSVATSKVELLYERAFTELEGVTAAMDQQLSRLLAEGLSAGRSPRQIATALKNQVTKLTNVRAKAIARTEIIRAHAEGQLDSFEVLGVKELDLLAEWSTAGDERVCFECAELEGVVMTIDEARGLLPRHPNCRCAWIPANVSARLPGQLFGSDKTSAIQKSIRAEGGVTKENRFRKSFKTTRPGSSWLGKERVPRSAVPGAKRATPRGPVTPAPRPAPAKVIKAPKPIPDAAPVVKSTNRMLDPEVQSFISDYERILSSTSSLKRIPVVIEKQLKKIKGRLARKGVRLGDKGFFDALQPTVTSETLPLSPTVVKTKPVVTSYKTKFNKWSSSLTDAEKEGIKYWSESVYSVGNVRDFQSGIRTMSSEIQAKIKAFELAIKKAPKFKGTVYRGSAFDDIASVKEGSKFSFKNAVSASKDLDVGEEFASYAFDNPTLFEIRIKSGVDISKLVSEEYVDQAEMFLRKGLNFRVISKEKVGDVFRVILEEF